MTSPNFDIINNSNGAFFLILKGPLTVKTAADIIVSLKAAFKKQSVANLSINFKNVTDFDDYGALVIYELKNNICPPDIDFKMIHAPEILKTRMNQMALKSPARKQISDHFSGQRLVMQTGEAAIDHFNGIKYYISFIGAITLSVLRIFRKPKSLRRDDIIKHMKTTGVDALPVVGLISFLIGLIMAFMSSLQLKQFGANVYVASLVALAMVSELGPIMTAIIVSGRSGSAYAAEISTMKISEEIDALVTMGFDPVLFLAVPRMMAAIVVIPLLTMFANVFAIAGGLLIGVTMLDLSPGTYISQTLNSLKLFELFWGLSKSLVFAILISGVGCMRGFQAKGGASAVGHAATSAVVTSIFLIVLFDSIFAVIRSYWG